MPTVNVHVVECHFPRLWEYTLGIQCETNQVGHLNDKNSSVHSTRAAAALQVILQINRSGHDLKDRLSKQQLSEWDGHCLFYLSNGRSHVLSQSVSHYCS